MGPSTASAGFTRWAGPFAYTAGCIASGPISMPMEPAVEEASPMLIDVLVRLTDSDGEYDDESLPSIVIAAVANLSVLFINLRLDDGPRYPGEDINVDALCANFSRLSLTETPALDEYPNDVLIFDGSLSSTGCLAPHHVTVVSNVMEVMVISAGTSKALGKASSETADPAALSAHTLHAALAGLKMPIATSTNPIDAQASLEEARRKILEEGIAIAATKRRMEAAQREYNSAYSFTPVAKGPSWLGTVRGYGLVIAKILGGKQSIYETPVANLRVAQAAMAEMPGLEGEERVLQEKRVKDLLDAANEQQTLLDRQGVSRHCRSRSTP
ncbi:hypothetical protein ZWY2020_006579 [Hordeum vulgare]|nr:hypothetical protein ZWY2020_006579 [Hordeum vulgare]